MKNINSNPFHLKGYHGESLFCDREDETKQLINNAENGVSTTLLSIRRMGKTGLIEHAFSKIKRNNNWECVYVDVFATQSLEEFTNYIASAVLQVFPKNKPIGKKFLDFITGFSPIISYDSLTGAPEISFNYVQPKQYEQSLKGIFNFLDRQGKQVVFAIDEFQQIVNFPEKNIEALLRTIIQSLKNTVFIFSGSHKHLLLEMFKNAKRPFFASTSAVFLQSIDSEKYTVFIKRLFKRGKKTIDLESIAFILNWTKTHTYYTQALCNKVFAISGDEVTIKDVYLASNSILLEQENIYFQYRSLLTAIQWKLLKAIAREDKVYQPTGSKFVLKYKLGNPTSVKRSLEALVTKEMVYYESKEQESYYQVYDCFLSRWLER